MYPEIGAIVDHARSGLQRHPLIMCEYSHAMGNSNGTLAEYWDAIESTPGPAGRVHLGVVGPRPRSRRCPTARPAGPTAATSATSPTTATSCTDGLVWPDRTPEARDVGAPGAGRARSASSRRPTRLARGEVTIRNHQDWTGLDWLRGQVRDRGRRRRRPRGRPGAARTSAPGERARRRDPRAGRRVRPDGREIWLTVALHDRRRDAPGRRPASRSPSGRCAIDDGSAAAPQPRAAADPAVAVDADGSLVHDLLASPPRLSLWRAPTDNDRIGGFGGRWTDLGVDRLERTVESTDRGRRGDRSSAAATARPAATRSTTSSGSRRSRTAAIRVDESVVIPAELGDLARIGTTFEVVPGLERFEWFGTGPHETYPDRKRGGLVGRWPRPSPTRPSRTSARRRTAATPTSAGSR